MKVRICKCKFLIAVIIFLYGCSNPDSNIQHNSINNLTTLKNLENTVLQAQSENLDIISNIRVDIKDQRVNLNRRDLGLLDTIEFVREKRGDIIIQIAKKENDMKKFLNRKTVDQDLKKAVREYWFDIHSGISKSAQLQEDILSYLNEISSLYNSQIEVGSLTDKEKEMILYTGNTLMKKSCNCNWEIGNIWAEHFFSDDVFMNLYSLRILELFILRMERLFLNLIVARVNYCCI